MGWGVRLEKPQTIDKQKVLNYKICPLNAPGISLPGPDFIAHAQELGDTELGYEGKKVKDKKLTTWGKWLDYLHRRALYERGFPLKIYYKTKSHNVRLIPGHIWSSDEVGPRRAKVMIIGKIPGNEEKRELKNLIGPSGDKLIECLNDIGEDSWPFWYVTNLIKWPHPEPFAGGTIPPNWIKDCLPLLQQELRLVRPKYILCLGNEAAKHVLGFSCKVSATVGQVFDIQIPLHESPTDEPSYHHAKVMTCTHPAAILRSPDMYPQYFLAMKSFCSLINGEEVGHEEDDIEHHFIDNAEDLQALVDEIQLDPANANLAWDSEWHGEHPFESNAYLRTIQFSWQPKKACCVILRHAGGEEAFKPNIQTAIKILNGLGKRTEYWPARAIGHFLRADLPWFIHAGLDLRKEYDAPIDDPIDVINPKFGWEKTRTEGGFDTGLAAHAHTEAGASYKLEVLANQLLGLYRYDRKLRDWKVDYCKKLKVKEDALEGYGECPADILLPYAAYDADATRRLFELYNKPDGLLDSDEFGNSCREAFWLGQRASLAVLEMEMNGILIDKKQTESMLQMYRDARAKLLQEIREAINWPSFNPQSQPHCRSLLFGDKYSGVIDKLTGEIQRIRPDDALVLDLTPIKTTGKRPKAWSEVVGRGEEDKYQPCADKEVLGILAPEHKVVQMLRNLRFIEQVLKFTLKPPKRDKKSKQELKDEEGHYIYDKGLLSYICSDGRVRTHLFQTLETGRFASARPNLQNISKRREADYARILGKDYKAPIRSVFIARPGYVLIEADYSGAELYGVAIMSRCLAMIDHCQRGLLDSKHPNYYDIHSNIAVRTFNLDCPPTKAGLASIGKEALRIAAKTVVFGLLYGRGAKAIARAAKEEGVHISPEQAQSLIDGFFAMYPEVEIFMETCRERPYKPGWMCNALGRFRRFHYSDASGVMAEAERQAQNYPIQSLVADAVSRALDHLYSWRFEPGHAHVWYDLLMQIHDAILFEVPIEHIETVYDIVIPECMTNRIPIWPTNLDGFVFEDAKQPYYLGTEREVYVRWGEKLYEDEAEKLGIPLRFAHKRKK